MNAYGYQIYRLNKETGKYEKIGKTTGASKTTYIDKDLEINTLYSYQVRASHVIVRDVSAFLDTAAFVTVFFCVVACTGVEYAP